MKERMAVIMSKIQQMYDQSLVPKAETPELLLAYPRGSPLNKTVTFLFK